MNKEVFISLEPLSYYFFGGERTFNTAMDSQHDNESSNYFAESRKLPQQTALLGMLRYLALVASNRLNGPDKKEKIGDNFDVGKTRSVKGWVQSLSPLIITKLENGNVSSFYLPKPFDNQGGAAIIAATETHIKSRINVTSNYTYILSNEFDYKEFNADLQWVDENGKVVDDLFEKSLTKSGVDIEKNKKKLEGGYYKQTLQKIKKGFAFGLWATIEIDDDIDMTKDYVLPFGADQGLFRVKFHFDIDNLFANPGATSNTIQLLSDCYVEAEDLIHVDFGLTDSIDFRFINSKTKDYYQLNNKTDKSGRYTLMKRGSVLYCNNGESAAEAIKAHEAFREIGYNYFKFK